MAGPGHDGGGNESRRRGAQGHRLVAGEFELETAIAIDCDRPGGLDVGAPHLGRFAGPEDQHLCAGRHLRRTTDVAPYDMRSGRVAGAHGDTRFSPLRRALPGLSRAIECVARFGRDAPCRVQ